MGRAAVSLSITLSPRVEAALSVLSAAAELSREVGWALIHLFEAGPQTGGADLDRLLASRGVEGGVVLEPSQLLLELEAAARAGEFDRLVGRIHGSRFP